MTKKEILRIVVASPGDVQTERDTVEKVAAELNHGIAVERGLSLKVTRWETDSFPGFHVEGPQGHIDAILRIEDCDLLIGIFWKRFGTPTRDAGSGTEHEFRLAYDAWKQSGRPQIMLYFNRKPFSPTTKAETEQWGQVLEFKAAFPAEGLWWEYNGPGRFESMLRNHLTQFLRQYKPPGGAPSPTPERGGHIPRPDVPPPDTDQTRRYLIFLLEQTRNLPLRGLDPRAADAQSRSERAPCLTDVYIDLDTTARAGREEAGDLPDTLRLRDVNKPLPALAAFGLSPRLALLGDPGSGKSTFLNHLGHCLADYHVHPASDPGKRLEGLPEAWREKIPIPIVLRDFAARVRNKQIEGEKTDLLENYLTAWCGENNLADFAGPLLRLLRDNRVLLLLDGWDEVADNDPAQVRLKTLLNALPALYPDCPLLLTCRTRSYEEKPWKLDPDRWDALRLLEFDEAKIDRFVEAWYHHLSDQGVVRNARMSADSLKAAVRRVDLRRMAGNPLLLTIMAIDHADKGQLPDARSVVYEDVVDLLLWKWREVEKPEGDATVSLRELLHQAGRQDVDFKRTLWRIAYEAHEGAPPDQARPADISEDLLRKRFYELIGDWNKADALLRVIQFRAGLLIPAGKESYTFPHRTFQEYLAACHVCSAGDMVKTALELARQGVYWWEVVLLAVNRLIHHQGDWTRPFSLVSRLCPSDAPKAGEAAKWRLVMLAGECLREIGLERAKEEEDAKPAVRVRERLAALVEEGHLETAERVRAGSTLGALGDTRKLDEMVLVPAGEFVMGSSEEQIEAVLRRNPGWQREWVNGEKPQRRVFLDAFRIRKYPVTVGEFRQFCEKQPYEYDWEGRRPDWGWIENHPMVDVTWHDAAAYCEWVGMRLPTEAEWEKAARGTDGRVYPWGDEWDGDRCANSVGDSVLSGTAPVGCFPSGASPFGCLDMAGNVWEWCADWYGEDYYEGAPNKNPAGPKRGTSRVLRGGAWGDYGPGSFRAAYRDRDGPVNRLGDIGFRGVALADSD